MKELPQTDQAAWPGGAAFSGGMDMGGHPEWERILDVGGDPGGKGSPAVGAGGSSEEGGGSE